MHIQRIKYSIYLHYDIVIKISTKMLQYNYSVPLNKVFQMYTA